MLRPEVHGACELLGFDPLLIQGLYDARRSDGRRHGAGAAMPPAPRTGRT
jgi:hypothetical protein